MFRMVAFQLHKNVYCPESIPENYTLHIFVCDSENYMEKLVGNDFLENLISVARMVWPELIAQ